MQKTKEILEKQLQLLSEESHKSTRVGEIVDLSGAMVAIVNSVCSFSECWEYEGPKTSDSEKVIETNGN